MSSQSSFLPLQNFAKFLAILCDRSFHAYHAHFDEVRSKLSSNCFFEFQNQLFGAARKQRDTELFKSVAKPLVDAKVA